MEDRRGYAKEISGVVLSFEDKTFISWGIVTFSIFARLLYLES